MAIISKYPLKVMEEVEPFPPIQNTANPYLTEAAMYADQVNQLEGYGYLVDGVGAFTYLGTVAGTAADYEGFGGGLSWNPELPSYSFDGYNHYDENYWLGEPNLVTMSNGNILMVYRKSIYYVHVGNTGELAGRISTDSGETFGDEFSIFSDQYDDRNQITGVLPNGDVIVVFRRYDDISSTSIDTGFVRSTDNGITWSTFTSIVTGEQLTASGEFMIRGANVYFITNDSSSPRQISLWESTDNFATTPTSSVIVADATKSYAEPIMMDIGEGKSILLLRNQSTSSGQLSYYQYNSIDGVNFTYKGTTNIFDDIPYSVRVICSLKYYAPNNELLVITNSRTPSYVSQDNLENELRIYIQDADLVFNNSNSYELKHSIPRPVRNDYWFYGYSGVVETNYGFFIAISDIKAYDRLDTLNSKNELSSIHTFKLNRINNIEDLLNYILSEPRLVIQNGYGSGKDYIDYQTISSHYKLQDYLKTEDSLSKWLLIDASQEIDATMLRRWLRVRSTSTLSFPATISANYEFKGSVDQGAILTIVSNSGLTINGEVAGTNFIVNEGSTWFLKYLGFGMAVLDISISGSGLDLRASNLAGDLSAGEQDGIKTKLNIPASSIPKEHEINGIRVTANVTGTYAIDWNSGSIFVLTMTANTTFSFSNLPTGVNSRIITVILTGAFVPTFPVIATLKPATDVYAGAKLNEYTINCVNGTAASEMIYYHNELLN